MGGERDLVSHSRPLILVTNDDGVHSPGLRASVEALCSLGELVVAAPQHQHSGAGRSFSPRDNGSIQRVRIVCRSGVVEAFGVEASPAQTVVHALIELVPRLPDLCVVGINYGENVGNGITASGTVGAALEAASAGIPSLAVSLQTASKYYHSHSLEVDFSAAAHFVRFFGRRLLMPDAELPPDADLLKIDVPQSATPETPWRVTRVSRQRYFEAASLRQAPLIGEGPLEYRPRVSWQDLELDSDIYALVHDRVVSVAPISIDLSARVDRSTVARLLASSAS
jgi:5'-nucleotidase